MSALARLLPGSLLAPGRLRAARHVALAALLALSFTSSAPRAQAQDIRESDLYFSDPVNLKHLLDEAARQATAGHGDEALAGATRVIDTARATPSPELAPVLGEALVLRARLRFARKDKAAATADLEEALARDPGANPAKTDRSPFAALFRATRLRAVGRLSVDSDPPGASVTLEGRRLGLTPVSGAAALTGTRYVKIERPGYSSVEREVVIGAKPARVSVTLERRSATFLLLTDADGAQVAIDGVAVGLARRPLPGEADELVAAYNLPIDPEAPPALFLWHEAVAGTHEVSLSAPCRKSLVQTVEIPEGSDSTTLLPMERTKGTLQVEGPPGTTLTVDRTERGTLPAVLDDLCPGSHLIEASAPPARRTRLTVDVKDGAVTHVSLRFLPVLAFLDDDPVGRAALAGSRSFNVVDASRVSGADPRAIVERGSVNPTARDLVIAATDAALLAWTERQGGRRALVLLAGSSPRVDRIALDPAGSLDAATLSVLDAPLALDTPTLGLVTADVRFLEHPIVVTLAERGPGEKALLKVGDEVTRVGEREIGGTEELDRATRGLVPGASVIVSLRRPTGGLEATLVVGRAATDPEFGRGGTSSTRGGEASVPPNVALARLASPVESGLTRDPEAPVVALARGKAWLALDAPEQAYAALAGAEIEAADGVGPGTLLYYRGYAAYGSGRAGEARDALQQALTYPASRILGPEGPPVLPLVRELLQEIDATPSDEAGAATGR